MARILVVEDDEGIRAVLSEFLRDEGHDVSTVTHLDHLPPDLSPVDYQLIITDCPGRAWDPDLSAVCDLTKRMAGVPVVLFTAHGQAEHLDPAAFGLAAIWVKPIDLEPLSAAIRALLTGETP